MSRIPSNGLPIGFVPVTSLSPSANQNGLPEGFIPVGNNPSPIGANPTVTKLLEGISPLANPAISKYIPGMVAGVGTGLQNIYNNASPIINKTIGSNLQPSNTNLYNALSVPPQDQQGFGNFLNKSAQYSPLLLAPEFAPEIGEASLAAKIGAPIARTTAQGTLGGLLSQNPKQGMETFGGIQGVLESVSPLARLALLPFHGVANLVNPINAAKSFGEGLQNEVANVKAQEQVLYAPMHQFEDQPLTDNPDSLINPKYEKHFSLPIEISLENFRENPTIGNAHKLQSDMFTVGNKITPKTNADISVKYAFEHSRTPILNAISNKLNSLSPLAGDAYDQGREMHATVLKKLIPTPFFDNVANDEIDSSDPNQIVKEYKKAFPKKSSIPNNYLTTGVNNLKNKIGMGRFLQYAGPMAIGSAMAHFGGSGIGGDIGGGALGGAIGGGMFARFEESPIIKNMLQNEGLHNSLQNMGSSIRTGLRYAVPPIAGNSLNNIPQSNTQ